MSSIRRVISARANGARSEGPKTPAGKRRSSLNAMRHGLLAKTVLLENESTQGFDVLCSELLNRFGPADGVELGFLEEMAASFWRMRRAWAIESSLLDRCLREQPGSDEVARIAGAFSQLASSPELSLLHRYETRLHCAYQRAFRNLLLLRTAEIPNEPNPISGHPATPPLPPPGPPDAPHPAQVEPESAPDGNPAAIGAAGRRRSAQQPRPRHPSIAVIYLHATPDLPSPAGRSGAGPQGERLRYSRRY